MSQAEVYVGIDPGLTGALAVLGAYGDPDVYDLPTVAAGRGTVKRELCAPVLGGLLTTLLRSWDPAAVRVMLERTAAMPGQGVASMFSMGVTRGVLLGVVGALGYPLAEVAPSRWKAAMGLAGADKGASRRAALQRFPGLAATLAREKDHNRAEAVLLALYAKSLDNRTAT